MTALTDFSGEPRESRPSAHDHDQIHVPRPIIWLTLALILFTIAAVSIGRIPAHARGLLQAVRSPVRTPRLPSPLP